MVGYSLLNQINHQPPNEPMNDNPDNLTKQEAWDAYAHMSHLADAAYQRWAQMPCTPPPQPPKPTPVPIPLPERLSQLTHRLTELRGEIARMRVDTEGVLAQAKAVDELSVICQNLALELRTDKQG